MWHQKAKGPPDGPPVFLIFVEKLNCPQSQAYQSISPVGTGLSLTDRALGVSLGTSIGNYSPLIAPQPVKLKMRRSDPCRFESGHRHHVNRGRNLELKNETSKFWPLFLCRKPRIQATFSWLPSLVEMGHPKRKIEKSKCKNENGSNPNPEFSCS